jgi:hypothetical protein
MIKNLSEEIFFSLEKRKILSRGSAPGERINIKGV